MKNTIVRIEQIEIYNFKNVKYGIINFNNKHKQYKSSILGLYGQNGSGKTALIDALALLKANLCCMEIPLSYGERVNVNAEYATLKFQFRVSDLNAQGKYIVHYEFSIKKVVDNSIYNIEDNSDEELSYKTMIFNEKLSYSYSDDNSKIKLQSLIDTDSDLAFIPKTKYSELVSDDKETAAKLYAYKNLSKETSRSFVFSPMLLSEIRQKCKQPLYLNMIEAIVWYGNWELFVVDNVNSGLITFNALPLAVRDSKQGQSVWRKIILKLNDSTVIPKEKLVMVQNFIDSLNLVLKQIVPGLTIKIKELGTELSSKGVLQSKIQLISCKNSKEIPLRYESEGIKKIISIIHLLISVYNNPSVTVAVDELDSGIFEYLLGELLYIISEKGKGQLIFTSHNLRPLETIDRGFIAFTTTNPENRYIRLANLKSNNNLRDFYYRDITLGEQKEEVYDATNNYEIAFSLREAGEISGS